MTTAVKPRPKLTLRDTSDLMLDLDRWIEDNVDAIELNGGALPDDLAALLDEIEESRLKKAEAIAAKLDEFAGNQSAAKAAKDRAARRERVWGNVIASMKGYVLRELARIGQDRIVAPSVTLRAQKNPPAVEIRLTAEQLLDLCDYDTDVDDEDGALEDRLPLAKYCTVRREVVVDKKRLAADYEARREQLEAETPSLDEKDVPAHVHGPARDTWVHDARETVIADTLAREFPAVSVTRGLHLRID